MKKILFILGLLLIANVSWGSIPLGSNFTLNAQLPLDSRTTVTNEAARDAIIPIQRYDGLTVYVSNSTKEYQLQGGVDNSNWVTKEGTSGAYVPLAGGEMTGPLTTDAWTTTNGQTINNSLYNFLGSPYYLGQIIVATPGIPNQTGTIYTGFTAGNGQPIGSLDCRLQMQAFNLATTEAQNVEIGSFSPMGTTTGHGDIDISANPKGDRPGVIVLGRGALDESSYRLTGEGNVIVYGSVEVASDLLVDKNVSIEGNVHINGTVEGFRANANILLSPNTPAAGFGAISPVVVNESIDHYSGGDILKADWFDQAFAHTASQDTHIPSLRSYYREYKNGVPSSNARLYREISAGSVDNGGFGNVPAVYEVMDYNDPLLQVPFSHGVRTNSSLFSNLECKYDYDFYRHQTNFISSGSSKYGDGAGNHIAFRASENYDFTTEPPHPTLKDFVWYIHGSDNYGTVNLNNATVPAIKISTLTAASYETSVTVYDIGGNIAMTAETHVGSWSANATYDNSGTGYADNAALVAAIHAALSGNTFIWLDATLLDNTSQVTPITASLDFGISHKEDFGSWRFNSDTDKVDLGSTAGMDFQIAGSYEAATIKTNGNVGIGTTEPLAKLDVDGATVIRNTLSVSGGITTLGNIKSNGTIKNITIVGTSEYIATATDEFISVVQDTIEAVTIIFPSTEATTAGKCYSIKDGGFTAITHNITITGEAGETFDGQPYYTLNSNKGEFNFISNGTNWLAY